MTKVQWVGLDTVDYSEHKDMPHETCLDGQFIDMNLRAAGPDVAGTTSEKSCCNGVESAR